MDKPKPKFKLRRVHGGYAVNPSEWKSIQRAYKLPEKKRRAAMRRIMRRVEKRNRKEWLG